MKTTVAIVLVESMEFYVTQTVLTHVRMELVIKCLEYVQDVLLGSIQIRQIFLVLHIVWIVQADVQAVWTLTIVFYVVMLTIGEPLVNMIVLDVRESVLLKTDVQSDVTKGIIRDLALQQMGMSVWSVSQHAKVVTPGCHAKHVFLGSGEADVSIVAQDVPQTVTIMGVLAVVSEITTAILQTVDISVDNVQI